MALSRCTTAFAIAWTIGLGVQTVTAQMPGHAPYQPAQPTLSPWFRLYDRNSGALDNYHSMVRPEIRLRSTLRQQDTLLQEQGVGLQGLSGQVNEIENHDLLRPTGAGSVFMDYSHYYDMGGAGARSPTQTRRVAGRPAGGS